MLKARILLNLESASERIKAHVYVLPFEEDMVSTLEEYYDKEIHHGRLYPNLDTLVNKGFVEKSQMDRRTNLYTLTARGWRELDARREWEQQYLHDMLSAA